MTLKNLMSTLIGEGSPAGSPRPIYGHNGRRISVYPRSVRMQGETLYFLGREAGGKRLFVVGASAGAGPDHGFHGEKMPDNVFGPGLRGLSCPLDHANAARLREVFPFTRPVLIGLADSFGFGDRLGIANPAHLRSLEGSHFRPVLAQQSIRELERTRRSADEVMDAASWAALQEGYTAGFGSDADHLKTPADIDRMVAAGFTMFTFDPSAYVVNEAATLPSGDLRRRAAEVATGDLPLDATIARYTGRTVRLGDAGVLSPSDDDLLRAFIKYGGVINHATALYRHLTGKHASVPSEVELSVDETDLPTTPADHFFVAAELRRLGVKLVSLAPRFVGSMEKGIDYKGDLGEFARTYRMHAAIAAMEGPYKLSIHSGSDKFSVYRVIGRLKVGATHVKTAGTSYLEALRTVAAVEPALAREILDFARGLYDAEKLSYHVSASMDRVPAGNECSDAKLLGLFDDEDARQAFHVTFGKVLTTAGPDGKPLFKSRLMDALERNEDLHYDMLVRHFRRHLEPFEEGASATPSTTATGPSHD